jgi:hypothetical protein
MGEPAFRDSDDPADLPLFTTVPTGRPGRVRSTFSMRIDPVATRDDTEAVAASSPAALLVRNPPHGWDQPHPAGRLGSTGVDWSLVARLRAQASDRLSAQLGDGQGHLDRVAVRDVLPRAGRLLLRQDYRSRPGSYLFLLYHTTCKNSFLLLLQAPLLLYIFYHQL